MTPQAVTKALANLIFKFFATPALLKSGVFLYFVGYLTTQQCIYFFPYLHQIQQKIQFP